MMIREEAAREKVCPLMALVDVVSKVTDIAGPGHCVGKECMFWRSFDKPQDIGYCGLAGIPND